MVTWYGKWIPEKDYTDYPDAKKCDCDRIAERILASDYEVKTDLENLVLNIIVCFDDPDNADDYDMENFIESCMAYVTDCGGFAEFDYVI